MCSDFLVQRLQRLNVLVTCGCPRCCVGLLQVLNGSMNCNYRFIMYKQFKSQRLWEAMKTACEEGDFEKVFELIKDGQDPRHGMSWMELKPLHCAAFHGNLEVVRTLVEKYGCNPRSAGNNKCTPLHYACCGGHQDVVKYLVAGQNCDPHLKSNEGCRPLHFTCIHEELDTYDISVRLMGSWYSSMKHGISTSGHYEVAKFLLTEGGCNVAGSYKRAPPLVVHLACRYGTVEFVQFLIEQKNCCPNNKNKNKDTPVHVASKYGNVEILRYLVEVKGCNLIQQNKDGNTPLHLACIFQHFETVQYLVKKQPCLTMVANHDKALPVHLACYEDSPETVELVTSASNVTAKDHNGATPLHVCLCIKYIPIARDPFLLFLHSFHCCVLRGRECIKWYFFVSPGNTHLKNEHSQQGHIISKINVRM